MSIIKQDYGEIGGDVVNPVGKGNGYLQPNGNATINVDDISKTFIVAVSANYSSAGIYMDVWLVSNGTVTAIYDTPNVGSTVTVPNNNIKIQSNSSSANLTYSVVQIN